MNLQLKTKEIRDFMARAKALRTNTLNPVLSYIKYDGSVLIKTNLETFYAAKISTKTDTAILLDEKILSAFLPDKSDTVTVIPDTDKKLVTLKDGKREVSFPMLDPETFPLLPEKGESKKIAIDETTLKVIGFARFITSQLDTINSFSYIHICNTGIYSSNGAQVLYYSKGIETEATALSKESALILSGYSKMNFQSFQNYNFFSADTEAYAFIKTEQRSPIKEFDNVLSGGTRTEFFEFEKDKLLSFCDFVSAVTPAELPQCSILTKDGSAFLDLTDNEYSVDAKNDFEVLGKWAMPLTLFNPKLFSNYLKALPYDLLRFSPFTKEGFITVWTPEDDSFQGILTALKN